MSASDRGQFIREIAGIHDLAWWNTEDGSKRRIMAECLVPRRVDPSMIDAIYVANAKVAKGLQESVAGLVPIVAEPHLFFEPTEAIEVTPTLSLVGGDMFFSRMQTLTVSVNTVGIMGKRTRLASEVPVPGPLRSLSGRLPTRTPSHGRSIPLQARVVLARGTG